MGLPRPYPVLTVDQQRHFWLRVARGSASQCWLWTGARKGRGYGAVRINNQPLSAHRVAWELTHGPVAPRQRVFQVVCNNPLCCNPNHLATGTPSDAMRAATRHGARLGRAQHMPVIVAPHPTAPRAKPYPRLTQKQEAAFWCKVARGRDDECWLWVAAYRAGYGVFRAGGRSLRASRLAYALTHGDPPGHMDVCHSCDVPLCVNPNHLFLGSPRDNMQDCLRKGRKNVSHGEAAGRAKLTADQVREIRQRAARGDIHRILAAEFGVTGPTVSAILVGKSWRHTYD